MSLSHHCIATPAGPHTDRGFSLIELLVVLLIASLLIALVPPLFSGAVAGTELRSTARSLSAALRLTRSRSITSGQQHALTLDLTQRWFSVAGSPRKRPIPSGLAVQLLTAQRELVNAERGRIHFYPDGSSSGGSIRLSGAGGELLVTVDWFSGGIRVLD